MPISLDYLVFCGAAAAIFLLLHFWLRRRSRSSGLPWGVAVAMAGVLLAIGFVARKHKLRYFQVSDVVGCATPIGLFLGRLANFVNGELYGRASDAPWAMVFPTDPSALPRHPSQLYQAALEGLVLFALLFLLVRLGKLARVGFLSGAFLAGYGLARILGEFFREPDPQLGFLFGPVTMGQLLSLPMVLVGLWFMARARPPAAKA